MGWQTNHSRWISRLHPIWWVYTQHLNSGGGLPSLDPIVGWSNDSLMFHLKIIQSAHFGDPFCNLTHSGWWF